MATQTAERSQTSSVHRELAAIVGAEYVIGGVVERRKQERRKKSRPNQSPRQTLQESLAKFAIDEVVPAAIVSPGSEEEIAGILRLASEKDYVVVPAGGFTKQGTGAIAERIDIVLQTSRLNRVVHYDAGDLTLGVGAGTTIAEVNKTLGAHSQFLPLDPILPERATIGGILAANSNGPMRAGFGGVRDYCIGVNFVTGDGKPAKGGGRVVKNVAGYDMMKLMIGSFGTLGVITSANFKVFPLPPQTCTFVSECPTLDSAIKLRDRIISSPLAPICLEIFSPRAQEYLAASGEVRDPDHYAPLAGMKAGTDWQVVVRASGSDAVLRRYRDEIGTDITRELRGAIEADLWHRVADFEHSVADRHRNLMVVNVSCDISSVRQAYEAAEHSAVEHSLLSACVGRALIGSLIFAFMPLGVDPPSAMQFANAASSLRSRLPKNSSAVVVRCPKESKERFDVWGLSPNDLAIMRGIRDVMDPKKILNRGRFIV